MDKLFLLCFSILIMIHNERSQNISKGALPILGFGIVRNQIEQPWYHRGDYVNAMPLGYTNLFGEPSRSFMCKIQAEYRKAGYIELVDTGSAPQGGRHQIAMRLTEEGVDPLLNTLAFYVTNRGLTLHELLHIPDTVGAVLEATDFKDRVISTISGIAVAHA
jgi:hypothetical protein